MSCPPRPRRRRSAGFSLIELMISMVIALVATLAIASVLVHGERSKRSTASITDLNQTGAYVAYTLDRQVRNAGSGFAQRWSDVFGCRLNASKDGVAVLPRAAAIASPFVSAPLSFPLAPVLVQEGGADSGGDIRGDLVTVMAGTGGFSETPPLVNVSSVQGTASNGSLRLANTLGFHNGDLVLLGDAGVPQGCMTAQVDGLPSSGGGTATLLPLAGQYYTATGSNVTLGSFGEQQLRDADRQRARQSAAVRDLRRRCRSDAVHLRPVPVRRCRRTGAARRGRGRDARDLRPRRDQPARRHARPLGPARRRLGLRHRDPEQRQRRLAPQAAPDHRGPPRLHPAHASQGARDGGRQRLRRRNGWLLAAAVRRPRRVGASHPRRLGRQPLLPLPDHRVDGPAPQRPVSAPT